MEDGCPQHVFMEMITTIHHHLQLTIIIIELEESLDITLASALKHLFYREQSA